jgi:hypothetical protein
MLNSIRKKKSLVLYHFFPVLIKNATFNTTAIIALQLNKFESLISCFMSKSIVGIVAACKLQLTDLLLRSKNIINY